jgi:ATP-dependent RNA helicase DeaD
MPAEVARIGKQFMKDPIEITVAAKNRFRNSFT